MGDGPGLPPKIKKQRIQPHIEKIVGVAHIDISAQTDPVSELLFGAACGEEGIGLDIFEGGTG
jgi:hypothetical protein